MRRAGGLAAALAASLLGCTLGPDYVREPVPEHATWRLAPPPGASVADLPWWELFGDPVLRELIEAALEGNRDLAIAMARIDQARASLGIARADLFPTVDVGLSASLQERSSSAGSDNRTLQGYVTASYAADVWGRARRSREAALQELLASEEAYRAVTLTLVGDVAATYLQLRDFDARRAIAERTAADRRESVAILEARLAAGLVSELEVEQARLQLADAEAAIEAFVRLAAQAEHALTLLLGRSPQEVPRGRALGEQALPPEVPAGLPSELVERRPDLRQAEALLAAQTARIGVAEATRFPSLSLGATGGALATDGLDAGFLTLGVDLFGPLFNAGRNRRRVELEKARTEELLQRYEKAILTAFREVEDAMVAARTFREERLARERQVASARSAAELAWDRYEAGFISYLEVLDARRSLFGAELQASDALQQQLSAIVRLYRALGGGWSREAPERASAHE